MINHILKQIWTQRKYNVWIFIELMLVFSVVWVLTDYGFILIHNRSIPQGFNTNDTYLIKYGVYEQGTSRFEETESSETNIMDNLELFTRKIKEYPSVEVADLTYIGWGSLPFSGGRNSTSIRRIGDKDSTEVFAEVKNVRSGDYFKIFRYTSAQNDSWERLANIDIRQNHSVFITKMIEKELFKNESAIGQAIIADIGEGKQNYVVADVINDQKRFDYTLPDNAIIGASPQASVENLNSFSVSIRVKKDTPEKEFITNFKKEMTKQLRIGNFYLKDIKSFHQLKNNIDYAFGVTNSVRSRTALGLFFLFNIALGVIATFWLRNETRRGEIGLRMALGSTRVTLQKQFIIEAIIIFTIATLPAIVVNLLIAKADIIKLDGDIMMPYQSIEGSQYIIENFTLRFLISNVITYIILLIIVVFSSWLPASKASRLHPVEALRDE